MPVIAAFNAQPPGILSWMGVRFFKPLTGLLGFVSLAKSFWKGYWCGYSNWPW